MEHIIIIIFVRPGMAGCLCLILDVAVWLRFRFRAPFTSRTHATTMTDDETDDGSRTNRIRETPPSIAYARDSMPHTSRAQTPQGGCNHVVSERPRANAPYESSTVGAGRGHRRSSGVVVLVT